MQRAPVPKVAQSGSDPHGAPSGTWQAPAAEHTVFPLHPAQIAPLAPHWVLVSLASAMQVFPLQHPAQLVESQLGGGGVVHWPLEQLVPLWQGAQD